MVILHETTEWAIDCIHTLCETNLEDAFSIQSEFAEWLDPDFLTHDIISLEYIGDKHDN